MSPQVPRPLPAATVDDLVNEEVPRQALATEGNWQEWLNSYTGRDAWVDGKRVAETQFMARAIPGELTGGYVKSAATRDGLALWEAVS